MSTPEITPELIRAVADWLDGRWTTVNAESLRVIADGLQQKLEREQADEKRIDELARTYCDAAHELAYYSDLHPEDQKMVRAGIRAVLAKLDEEKAPGVSIPDGAPLYFGRAYDAEYLRWPVNPWKVSPGTWTLPEFTPGPRQWDNLADVPKDVAIVRGANGVVEMRVYSLGAGHEWLAAAGPNSDLVAAAPYTEIVGGAQ
ncbi:hypothetical protein [Rhodococcus zopfii]|uniref:hypothetical protein n=1 Tax=Rhodococcus zopfii TaxID=43772 RepID=UPI000934B285|nr:hypothetical protein [Rhodococcus zopfii]